MKLRLFFLLAALQTCYSADKGSPAGYPIHHNDVATVTTSIKIQGKEIDIKYSKDSNQEALQALINLKMEVYLPNACWGSRIFVVGELSPDIFWTPNAPGELESSPYQMFTLKTWYIVTPFKFEKDLDHVGVFKRHLEPSDFEKAPPDISIYQRQAEKKN